MRSEGREVSLFEAPIGKSTWRRLLLAGSLILSSLCVVRPALGSEKPGSGIVDLSLMVAPNLPATWPHPKVPNFQISHYLKIGPEGAYNSDILTIDGNTGTQLDVPPHSVARPELGFPNSGPYGHMFIDRVPPWQFGGEACVVDLRSLRDAAPKGHSALIERKHIEAWEREHRPLRPGDVVLFYSGYSDHYYKPLPRGRRFIAAALDGDTPGWPDPSPDCMEYLAGRGVRALGTDSPSMGPLPDLAEPTHYAGLKHGMIWTEGVIGLGKLPSTGAFYCMLGPKHSGAPFGEGRAFAIVEKPLAARLVDSVRKMRVVDLSVTLAPELPVTWPGTATGEHRHPYHRLDFWYIPHLDLHNHTHMLDSHAGTHLVPPSYALPPPGFDNSSYPPRVQGWLAEYEREYGTRGTSQVTTEQVPLSQTMGPARVIDVRHLLGSVDSDRWPDSPKITVADIRRYEAERGTLNPGDIVLFHSGHVPRTFKPHAEGEACMSAPLQGKSEGWPAPGPEAIAYLAEKGIRCVGTDGPSLGGVNPQKALATYWALGTRGMVGVEFLTHVGEVPEGAFFLFAPVKIRGCHGGPGRAIALY